MSRVIKQNYVTVSEDKKVIQNKSDFRVIQPEIIRAEEKQIAKVIQSSENKDLSSNIKEVEPEDANKDFSEYEAIAEKILEEANEKKAKIYEEAYHKGMSEAKAELERRRFVLEKEYQDKKDQIEEILTDKHRQDYQNEIQRLEGKMIRWLQAMLVKLVGQAKEDPATLMHLIRMGMEEISLQGDLIIRVSEEDLDYVLEHKTELTEELSEKLTIEVLKDQNLKKNECIIETIMGNIECSLGVQLKGLIGELQLIHESIMKNVND